MVAGMNDASATETVLTICNKKGLHARAAAKFVTVVNSHHSEVTVQREGCPQSLFDDQDYWTASGGSVLGILTLGAEQGCQIRISAKGEDAPQVIAELKALIERKFDEGE